MSKPDELLKPPVIFCVRTPRNAQEQALLKAAQIFDLAAIDKITDNIGVDLNITTEEGESVIFLILKNFTTQIDNFITDKTKLSYFKELVNKLLTLGVNINLANKDGAKPLDIASQLDSDDLGATLDNYIRFIQEFALDLLKNRGDIGELNKSLQRKQDIPHFESIIQSTNLTFLAITGRNEKLLDCLIEEGIADFSMYEVEEYNYDPYLKLTHQAVIEQDFPLFVMLRNLDLLNLDSPDKSGKNAAQVFKEKFPDQIGQPGFGEMIAEHEQSKSAEGDRKKPTKTVKRVLNREKKKDSYSTEAPAASSSEAPATAAVAMNPKTGAEKSTEGEGKKPGEGVQKKPTTKIVKRVVNKGKKDDAGVTSLKKTEDESEKPR